MAGPAGREQRNGGLKPFDGMKVSDLKREFGARGINTTGNKPELERRLQEELASIQRVPAICFGSEGKTMCELHLQHYELAASEPLHDIKEHMKNIVTELPEHLNNNKKEHFQTVTEAVHSTKGQMRGSVIVYLQFLCIHISKKS